MTTRTCWFSSWCSGAPGQAQGRSGFGSSVAERLFGPAWSLSALASRPSSSSCRANSIAKRVPPRRPGEPSGVPGAARTARPGPAGAVSGRCLPWVRDCGPLVLVVLAAPGYITPTRRSRASPGCSDSLSAGRSAIAPAGRKSCGTRSFAACAGVSRAAIRGPAATR